MSSDCPSGAEQFYRFMMDAPRLETMVVFRGDSSASAYKIGDVIPRPYFTSSSFNPFSALPFDHNTMLQIKIGKNVPVVDVRDKSVFPDEFEILLPPCYLTVVDIVKFSKISDWLNEIGTDNCIQSYYKNVHKYSIDKPLTVLKVKAKLAKQIEFTENKITLGGY